MEAWNNIKFSTEENETIVFDPGNETIRPVESTVVAKLWTGENYNVRSRIVENEA